MRRHRGAWLALLVGCQGPPTGGGAVAASSAPHPAALPAAASTPGPAARAASPPPGPGGLWVRCYAHARPTGTPRRDLERLVERCGPPCGMRPGTPILEGVLAEGQRFEAPITLERGQCVRGFAVADAGVNDLDLTLLGPGGAVLAADEIEDRWPVVPPDGTICTATGGAHTIRLTARKGAGVYAAQLWLLP